MSGSCGPLKQKLIERRMFIDTRTRLTRPRPTLDFAYLPPAGSCKGRPRFGGEDVCANPKIAESKCGAGRCSIKEGTGVTRPVSGKACNLQGPAIVAVTCDWPANNGNADYFAIGDCTEGEFVTDNLAMMPMDLRDEGVRR